MSGLRNSPPEQPEPTDYDYEYRVDTDVITPVTLYAGSEINPDGPATVTFTIKGSTYRMRNIVIPEGGQSACVGEVAYPVRTAGYYHHSTHKPGDSEPDYHQGKSG